MSVDLKLKYNWIAEEFLANIIKINDNVLKINNFTIKQAVGKGENYNSELLRVNVNYLSNRKSDV